MYRRPSKTRGRQVPCFDPKHLQSVNIYEARTTTSTTAVARMSTSLYELVPPETHASKVYYRDDARGRMLAMYELNRVLLRVRVVRCTKPLFCLAAIMWKPGIREHPIFLHDTLAPISFCIGIPVSFRNRYVVVASFLDSLSWHPFSFPPR